MSAPLSCFSIEELEHLDAHQVDLLRNAIERELRENEQIKGMLKTKFQAMYDRMKAGTKPAGRATARVRRARARSRPS
jgi:hypothetical protein